MGGAMRNQGNGPTRTHNKGNTSRWLIFITAIVFVASILAPPLQRYFSQQAQINALKAQVAQSKENLASSQKKLAQLNDPSYIASLAHSRLYYVYPGERQYIISGLQSKNKQRNLPAAPVSISIPDNLPWYGRLIATLTGVANKDDDAAKAQNEAAQEFFKQING